MADADREPDRPGVLKDGWNRIARDLDRAFALAGLGMHESLVLQVAREGCWVLPSLNAPRGVTAEPEPCLINLTLLAEKTGRTRQLVSRALGSLVASNILRRFEDGSVIINKDYTSWVFPGDESGPDRPRFTPDQVEYIRAAKFLGIVTSHRNPQVAPPQPTGCTDCNPQVAPTATHRLHPKPSAIEDRARGIELESKREGGEGSPPPQLASLQGAGETGPGDQPELDAIARSAGEWFPTGPEVSRAIAGRHGAFPVAWYRAAAERLRSEPPEKHGRDYFMGILRGFRARGGPPPGRNGHAPPTPPPFVASPEQRAHLLEARKRRNRP